MKWYWKLLVLVAMLSGVVTISFLVLSGVSFKEQLNEDRLTSLGFNVMQSSLYSYDLVIFISDIANFVSLARDYQIGTIFLSSRIAFFPYNGTVYAYSW